MSDVEAVRKVIENHNADLSEAFASGDLDRYGSYFAEDCWQMNPGSKPFVGRAALVAGWREQQELGQWAFDLQSQDVVVDGALAVERGVGKLSFTVGPETPPGMDSWVGTADYLAVWRLEHDGEWRILWDAPVELPAG